MCAYLSRILKQGFVLLLLFTFGLGLVPTKDIHADDGGFYIEDYDVYSILHDDNTMEVEETILVNFYSPRHGIYRNIPERMWVGFTPEEKESDPFHTWRAEEYKLKIRNIEVEGYNYSTSSEDGEKQIKIGSASSYVNGLQEYKISYTIVFPKDYRDTRDFIFYSPLGANWNVKVNSLSFTLDFDEDLSKEEIDNIQIFSGSVGKETNSLDVDYNVSKNQITGYAEDIPANNAVTIFGSLHEGYFTNANSTVSNRLAWITIIIAIVFSILVLLKEFSLRSKKYTETIEFYPPENTSSAQVGYIIDGSADVIDLMSLVPYWANEGYLTIEETDKESYLLCKQMKLPPDRPNYERTLFNALFNNREKIDMSTVRSSTQFGKSLSKATEQLKDSFKGEKQLSSLHAGSVILSFLSLVAMGACILFNSQAGFLTHLFEAIFFSAAFLILWIMQLAESTKQHFTTSSIGSKLLNLLFVLIGIGAIMLASSANDRFLPTPLVLIAVILLTISILQLYHLDEPSEYWLENAGKLAGLKTFIQTSEVPRLEALSKENPSYFFDIIPYAIAFGLSQQWAKAFEAIPLTQPTWYHGHHYDQSYMYYRMFDRHINQNASASLASYTASVAASAARSSVSGGFSGGGGGGGGGGSW